MKIPKEQFDKLWNLNPTGKGSINYDSTYSITCIALEEKDKDGNKITLQMLIDRYTEYKAYINMINEGRERKYHKPLDTIFSYIDNKGFNSSYKEQLKNSVDFYLYGIL